jgi:hypothetical protein
MPVVRAAGRRVALVEGLEDRRLLSAVNDPFGGRITLTGNAPTASGTTVGATKEAGEPDHGFNSGGHSVWYTWTAPGAGKLVVDTIGSTYDTTLGVYTGNAVDNLTMVPGGLNDDAPDLRQLSRATISVNAGQTYQIAVDGFAGAAGNYSVNLHYTPPAHAATTTTVTSAVGSLSGEPVRPDHIVVVIYEDRAAHAIGDTAHMPYFNQLASSGLVLTNSHGVGSEDVMAEQNYLALYSGSTQGVVDDGREYSFPGPNLAKSLFNAGYSFSGFSESLPFNGSQANEAQDPNDPDDHPDGYVRQYNASAMFTDVGEISPGVARPNSEVNKTFGAFPTTAAGYANLPTISVVIPNMFHNTHGSNEAPYTDASNDYDTLRVQADNWVHDNLGAYEQWARANNSILILTGSEGDRGNPYTGRPDIFADGVTTIITGDPRVVEPGTSGRGTDQYSLLRTFEDMYDLPLLGNSAQASPLATDSQGRLAPPGASGLTSAAGQAVSFTATVTPTNGGTDVPQGSVQFKIDGVNIGAPAPLIKGVATLPPITSLAGGNHSVVATYLDTPDFATSTSNTLTHTVQGGTQQNVATSTALTSTLNPATAGAAVQFKATVTSSSGTPTGTVQFLVDGANFGSPVTLVNGVANSSVTTSLSQGAHSVTAVYSGGTGFNASTSQALTQNIRPANDAFSGRITVSGTSVSTSGSNVGATKETGEPNHAGNSGGKSVWYQWTAPAAGSVTIDTTGSNFNTLLAAYTGSSVAALSTVASNNDSGGLQTSDVTFNVTSGTAYKIAIDGSGGAGGSYNVHLAFTPALPKAPTGVSATNGTYSDRVRVTWSAVAGATSYEIWRNTSNKTSGAVKIGTATSTSFDDLTGTRRKVYYYFVKTVNAAGTSGFSSSNSGYRR